MELKSKDLTIKKAVFSDWRSIYENVWSSEKTAKYMMWSPTNNEADAKSRMERTLEFQKSHDAFFIYLNSTGEAIGFTGYDEMDEGVYCECGIAIGEKFAGKGYGKQVLNMLIEHCLKIGGKKFIYRTDEENIPSKRLVQSFGFDFVGVEEKIYEKDGIKRRIEIYSKKIGG